MNKLTIFLLGLSCFLGGYIVGGLFGGKGGFKQVIGNQIYHGCKPKEVDEDDYSGEDDLRKLDGAENIDDSAELADLKDLENI